MSNLSDEQLRVRVADKAGWTNIHKDDGSFSGMSILCGESPFHKPHTLIQAIPDYTTSLDAIQKVVLEMDYEFLFNFQLQKIADEKKCYFHQLTARDWCIAFLRACGEEV